MAGLTLAVCGITLAEPASNKTGQAQSKPEAKEPSYTGILTTVNANENALTVRRFPLKKSFSIGEGCGFTLADGQEGKLADLQPGHKVTVTYLNASGVAVARHIRQVDLALKGSIDAIDRHARVMSVRQGWLLRKFQLPPDCQVTLRDNREGALDDLKVGHPVRVTYRDTEGARSAYRVEQKNWEFSGVIDAIDATAKTVKARQMFDDKKFSLARDCRIIANGNKDARLPDLKIGEKAEFTYELVNGVAIVHRISQGAEPVATASAEPAKGPAPQPEPTGQPTGRPTSP